MDDGQVRTAEHQDSPAQRLAGSLTGRNEEYLVEFGDTEGLCSFVGHGQGTDDSSDGVHGAVCQAD